MDDILLITVLSLAIIVSASVVWLILKTRVKYAYERGRSEVVPALATLEERLQHHADRITELQQELGDMRDAKTTLTEELSLARQRIAELDTQLEHEQRAATEKLKLLQEARGNFTDTFKSLASETLKGANESFLTLAQSSLERYYHEAKQELHNRQEAISLSIQPLNQSISQLNDHIHQMEKERGQLFGSLNEQVKALTLTHAQLHEETARLEQALRNPVARGRWGELQLRRVVEIAGMVEQCDFVEQESREGDDGRLRPDMTIKLPQGRSIVVDSKAPLNAYLEAVHAVSDQEKQRWYQEHARHLRSHLVLLSKKSYWEQFQPSPEFVVLFLPGESFFATALKADPELIEFGVKRKVMLATPTTLIALLKAIAYGWKEEIAALNAQHIGKLGQEVYSRLQTWLKHLARVGSQLNSAVVSYNRAVGSLENRVMVSARKLGELSTPTSEGIPQLEQVEVAVRSLADAEEENV